MLQRFSDKKNPGSPPDQTDLWNKMSLRLRLTLLVILGTVPIFLIAFAIVVTQASSIITQQTYQQLSATNRALSANVSTWLRLNEDVLKMLVTQPDIISMDPQLQKPVLVSISRAFPHLFLVHTTDVNGINVARNDNQENKDYSDRLWYQGAIAGLPVSAQVLISRTTGQPALNLATAIRDSSGKIVGVGSIVSELSDISQEVLVSRVGTTGYSYVISSDNLVLAHPDPTYAADLRDLSGYPPVIELRKGKTGPVIFTDAQGKRWLAHIEALNNGWGVITQQEETELLQSVRSFQTISLITLVAGISILIGLAWFVIQRSVRPIIQLTEIARTVSKGNLDVKTEIKTGGEIGELAIAFNLMTSQLRDTIRTLEQRVAERTRDLEASTEVSRRLSTILDERVLAQEVVEQLQLTFGYHHVHIYFFDKEKRELLMAGGTGETGRMMLAQGHKIQIGNGLIGRSAQTNTPILVTDVHQDPAWTANPILPDTQSEAVVPIALGDNVLGVLDIHQNTVGGITPESITLIQSITNQVAIALQNARSFTETQRRAEHEALIRRVGQKIQSAANIDEILKITLYELGQALGPTMGVAELYGAPPIKREK